MKVKFRFSSSEQFYAYIGGLIQRLNEAGETTWASGLKAAMANGSTGNEVTGNIWLKLKELDKSAVPARLGISDEIKAVTKDVGKALKRWR